MSKNKGNKNNKDKNITEKIAGAENVVEKGTEAKGAQEIQKESTELVSTIEEVSENG